MHCHSGNGVSESCVSGNMCRAGSKAARSWMIVLFAVTRRQQRAATDPYQQEAEVLLQLGSRKSPTQCRSSVTMARASSRSSLQAAPSIPTATMRRWRALRLPFQFPHQRRQGTRQPAPAGSLRPAELHQQGHAGDCAGGPKPRRALAGVRDEARTGRQHHRHDTRGW